MIKPNIYVEKLDAYSITPQDVWSDDAPPDILKIDWNEAPSDLTFYQKELKKIIGKSNLIAWYPDCLSIDLIEAISNFINVRPNFILTFPGSDVGLDTLCRSYLNVGDKVMAICPTYENFFVYVNQMGADLSKLVLEEPFILDYELVANEIESHGELKMFYLANPNNPCGYAVTSEIIEKLAIKFPQTIFVIDEAYIEFTKILSSAPLAEKYSNVVILRSFSKAFGMAGLRLGYMCAPIPLIQTMNKIRNGKNVSMMSQKLGIFAMENFDLVKSWIDEVVFSRKMFQDWCINTDVEFFPSEGNFVLFKASSPFELCKALKAEGIYIRNRDSLLPGYVRITIGSRSQTERLIRTVEKFMNYLVD